ncbi:hypothetical protein [Halorussus caseinilyticus]|uniref:hypothetical protein n=1 Tax=Halorussus caseinilyticus TaxID=3034025 RepID=UPI0023E77827|nr:hypothetical protein [Halorussus sp. DT72]
MEPTVTLRDDGRGIRIFDPIENAYFEVETATPVAPDTVACDHFRFPVETAVELVTTALQIPELTSIFLHTDDGLADAFDPSDGQLQTDGPRTLEVNIAPTKLYLRVNQPVTIHRDGDVVRLDFDGETVVRVGVRSLHDRPAGTITTTPNPEGAMRAVSLLGSALKTTSPERSFPTLRGHPPLIEVGDEFDAPDGINRPDTGVRIEVPPEYEYVYPVSSLAYYLGAEVVPGDRPRLATDDGFAYSLDGPEGFEQTVGRVLRQTFLLDCVTRTEGYYQVDLHERQLVESEVDLEFTALYDRPLADRLSAYLGVSFETVADVIPDWPLTVDVDPTVESLDAIPFVANDLAVVRTTPNPDPKSVKETPEVITDFLGAKNDEPVTTEFVTPEPVPFETIGHAWVGDRPPVGANKLTVESLRRSLDVDPDESPIRIHVVCNDTAMQDEQVVSEYYQLNEHHRFDISMHTELSVAEFRELLADPADFLHYIGHVDDDGIVCPDGHLDTTTLVDVNVKAFLLNACDSHEQGMGLVEAGSLGGIITLSDIADSIATRAGLHFARLLAAGHTLRTSVHVLRKQLLAGTRWMTVGNGGLSLCHCKSGNPLYLRISCPDKETWRTEVEGFPSPTHGLGTAFSLYLDSDTRYLVGGQLATLDLNASELDKILESDLIPIDFNDERYWSNEVAASDLR